MTTWRALLQSDCSPGDRRSADCRIIDLWAEGAVRRPYMDDDDPEDSGPFLNLSEGGLAVATERNAVLLTGPRNIALSMSAEAAERSAERLMKAAAEARRWLP